MLICSVLDHSLDDNASDNEVFNNSLPSPSFQQCSTSGLFVVLVSVVVVIVVVVLWMIMPLTMKYLTIRYLLRHSALNSDSVVPRSTVNCLLACTLVSVPVTFHHSGTTRPLLPLPPAESLDQRRSFSVKTMRLWTWTSWWHHHSLQLEHVRYRLHLITGYITDFGVILMFF